MAMNYLIVDDEKIILEGMEWTLRDVVGEKAVIYTASDPYSALDIIREHKIDIMFCDVDMPGRNFFAYFLLFTMIFSGGMIPEYLVMKQLGLVNNMWILVFKHGINVYNIVLMRNFFEGIPSSLYEAAKIDGCSPMGIFFKIVLPLSKAALASIGLMFAVTVWNDYSTVKIYITEPNQTNFQYQLRNMIMDGDTPTTSYQVSQNTLYYAGIVMAILPFMLLYPFLQKYFVKGVNIGAVKE